MKAKSMKSLVSIVLVTLMLTAVFVGTASAAGTTEEWKTYVDAENNFSISYPKDWEVPPFYVGGAFIAAALEENEPVATVQQFEIGRKRKADRALNPKRGDIFSAKSNCGTASLVGCGMVRAYI